MNYKELRDASSEFNERKDCAVIAVAAACQVSYKEAHEALKLFGRMNRKGTYLSTTNAAIRFLGFQLIPLDLTIFSHKFTPRTIGKITQDGQFICRTKKHIFTVSNGEVLDWTKDRCHRIIQLYKVEKRFEMRFK